MNSWDEFSLDEPELAKIGKKLLFPDWHHVGLAFLATLRKDGAPRLHPVCLVFSSDHLYVFIPPTSPKCADLKRDGRFAIQAFPPKNKEDSGEFYLAGRTECIQDISIRIAIIDDTKIRVDEGEELFELLFDRAMYTKLVNQDTPSEHPLHTKWRTNRMSN